MSSDIKLFQFNELDIDYVGDYSFEPVEDQALECVTGGCVAIGPDD